MNADGSGQRRLARNATFIDWSPDPWSPDGQLVSFWSGRAGNSDIYVMNADGSGVRNLTRSAADEHTITWSPDGRKIAFVRSLDGGNSRRAPLASDIHVMNADGSGQRRLTRSAGWLVWSPAQKR